MDGKHELLAGAIFFAWTASARGPETKEYGCLGPCRLLGGPLGAQGPRHGGPGPHTPLMSPGFDGRGQMAVSARRGQMTAFAWFLRPLTEWPGFPTLLYIVIQVYTVHSCSSFAWEVFFHRNIILGKQNTFVIFIIIIAPRPQLLPSRRRPKPSKRLCFGLSAKNAPTYY